jgi:hypothetical protein
MKPSVAKHSTLVNPTLWFSEGFNTPDLQRHDPDSHGQRSRDMRHVMPGDVQKMYSQGEHVEPMTLIGQELMTASSPDSLGLRRAERHCG